jgi:hypothetical protein
VNGFRTDSCGKRVPPVYALFLVLIVALTSCQTQTCSDVGAPSTIGVDVGRVLADVHGPVRARLCVEDTCDSTSKPNGQHLGVLYVDEPSIDDEGPVTVELVIESGSGETIFEGSQEVELTLKQPNGPDCEPSTFARALVASRDGTTLLQLPPRAG